MRTTVTLDADVEQLIRAAQERQRATFKQVLNEAVRRGLKSQGGDQGPSFAVEAKAMGLRSAIDPARLRDVDDELEIRQFQEKTRQLKTIAE